MEEDFRRFSVSFWYIKEDQFIKVFNVNKEAVCSLKLDFDEDNLEMSYEITSFNGEYTKIPSVWEIINTLIESALINSCGKLEIDSIPMEKKDLVILVDQAYKKLFDNRFKIIKIKQKPLLNVVFEIKQQKNTHYIQQAYLRNFSSNKSEWKVSGDKDKARIFRFSKKTHTLDTLGNTDIEKKYGPKISSIAKEEYFYSLIFEVFIANTLEKDMPLILDKIFAIKSIGSLSEYEKMILVQCLLFTLLRPKEARLKIRESMEKAILIEAKRYFKDELPDGTEAVYKDPLLKTHHEKQILDFIAPNSPFYIVDHLLKFEFRLLKARGLDFFITSDNPVILNNTYYLREKKKRNDFIKKNIERLKEEISNEGSTIVMENTSDHPERGLRVKGIEFYFPISPQLCLCIYDKQEGISPLSLYKIKREIILQSNQYIYSHSNKLDFIEKVIKRNPDCVDKDGKRSIVIGTNRPIPKEYRYRNLSRETYEKFLGFDEEE